MGREENFDAKQWHARPNVICSILKVWGVSTTKVSVCVRVGVWVCVWEGGVECMCDAYRVRM